MAEAHRICEITPLLFIQSSFFLLLLLFFFQLKDKAQLVADLALISL